MDQEIEVKYLVKNLEQIKHKTLALGGQLIQPRVREINWRYDTPTQNLRQKQEVLRLRQDTAARLTFKGSGFVQEGVLTRTEIEFEVSDFAAADRLLEHLGYQVFFIYEKFRQNYRLEGLTLSLDELPIGNFVELEGRTPQLVRQVSDLLGLDWQARVNTSYTDLFYSLKARNGYTFRDLSFDSLRDITVSAADLQLQYADPS